MQFSKSSSIRRGDFLWKGYPRGYKLPFWGNVFFGEYELLISKEEKQRKRNSLLGAAIPGDDHCRCVRPALQSLVKGEERNLEGASTIAMFMFLLN